MEISLENRLGALRQISERKLLKILDSISGLKDLIIEPTLMKPLERFTGVISLRKHGIEKIFRLETGSIPIINSQRVFLMYSELNNVKQVLNQIKAERQQAESDGKIVGHHLVLAVGSTSLNTVSQLIEEEGLWGFVTFNSLSWDFLKIDEGLWSLELPSSFKSLMFQNDLTMLKPISKAIWALQLVLGRPALVLGQGSLASKAISLTDTFRWPQEGVGQRGGEGSLGCLVVISRDIDWPSVLLTPVTYTALVNQVLGVRCGYVSLPSLEASSKASDLALTSRIDPIYQHIRNLHFSSVFPYLREQTQALQSEATSSKALSAAEIKQYVKQRLAQAATTKKSLTQHIAACEAVVEQVGASFESLHTAEGLALRGRRGALHYAEDLLGQKQVSLEQCLRLVGLLSLAGLHDEAASLRNQLFLCHGHQCLAAVDVMERNGLFGEGEAAAISASTSSLVGKVASAVNRKATNLQNVAKRLRLFPADESAAAPNPKLPAQDMSYVFGGTYTPVVCRVVEWLIRGDTQLEEGLKLLPGPTVWRGRNGDPILKPSSAQVNPKTFFVLVIGGITYAEVAAFQILEALTGAKIIVAGTSILNKDALTSACASS